MKNDDKSKPLTKIERFVCEMVWGNVPLDVVWVRESTIFKQGTKRFNDGEWKEIFDREMKSQKQKS